MDFAGMIQTWIAVLTKPGEEIFEQEQNSPRASLSTALIWIVIAAVVTAVLGFMQSLLFTPSTQQMTGMIEQMNLPPESADLVGKMLAGGLLAGLSGVGAFLGIILTPIFFLIGTGIIHLIATMLRGQGDFGRFAYLSAAIQSPISIVTAFLGFVPVVGGCVVFLISIYSLVLYYFAVKVSYRLTSGRAIAVILIPVIAVFLIAACVAIAVTALAINVSQ